MKKFIAVLLTCVMVLCVFCSCGSKESEEPNPEDGFISGVPNPMVETDENGIMNALGFDLGDVEGAEDVKYFIIDDSMGETQFMLNGVKIIARITSAAEFTDISGAYYTWTAEEECQIGGRDGKMMRYIGENETVDVCLWYDVVPGIMYAVIASGADLDGFDVTAVAERVFVPVQGEN